MDAEGPTDVLAFPIDDPVVAGRWPDAGTTGPDRDDPEPGDLPLLLGDVVVCPAVAAAPGARRTPAPTTTSWRCWWCTACSTCSATTTPSPRRPRSMQARERELLDRFHHRR